MDAAEILAGSSDADAADTLAIPDELADDDAAQAGVTIADIFGDDADDVVVEPSHDPGHAVEASSGESDTQLWLPNLPPLPKGGRVHTLRLPKIISVALDAYEPATYSEAAELAALRAAGKTTAIDAMIRYRIKRDAAGRVVTDEFGVPVRESNAQIVEWSDGSLTLKVGKEVVALAPQRTGGEHTTLFARVTSHQPDAVASGSGTKRSRDETVLEAQSLVSHRLLVRGLDGSSLLADRSVIEARVLAGEKAGGAGGASRRAAASAAASAASVLVDEALFDPQAAAERRIKMSEESARMLDAHKRRSDQARGGGSSRVGSGAAGTGESGARDDYGDSSLAAIKRRAKKGGGRRGGGSGQRGRRDAALSSESSSSGSGSDGSSDESSSSSGDS